MEETNVLNSKAGFHQKMKTLFAEISALDWEPDKNYDMGKGPRTQIVRYVSLSKIKRNISPVLAKSPIDIDIGFSEPKALGENLFVTAYITLTDTETGYSETYQSCGMSGKGEKATQIAQSFAVKSYLSNRFMLIDGMDPDRDDATRAKNQFGIKSMDEVADVKSKIQENAMSKEELAPAEEQPKVVPENAGSYTLSPLEEKTVSNIVAKWDEKLKKGEVSHEQYDEMEGAKLDAMESKEAVLAFIRKFKVI